MLTFMRDHAALIVIVVAILAASVLAALPTIPNEAKIQLVAVPALAITTVAGSPTRRD